MLVGIAAILVGLIMVAVAFRRQADRLNKADWRAFIIVTVAISSFILLVDTLGLLPAVAAIIAISCKADPKTSTKAMLGLVAVLVVSIWLIFLVGLSVPVPAFKGFW
jgi:putative tricarboxylic transport membrane protein